MNPLLAGITLGSGVVLAHALAAAAPAHVGLMVAFAACAVVYGVAVAGGMR